MFSIKHIYAKIKITMYKIFLMIFCTFVSYDLFPMENQEKVTHVCTGIAVINTIQAKKIVINDTSNMFFDFPGAVGYFPGSHLPGITDTPGRNTIARSTTPDTNQQPLVDMP